MSDKPEEPVDPMAFADAEVRDFAEEKAKRRRPRKPAVWALAAAKAAIRQSQAPIGRGLCRPGVRWYRSAFQDQRGGISMPVGS